MRKLTIAFLAFAAITGLSACSNHPELRSPCVGAEGSPCERRNPVNNVV